MEPIKRFKTKQELIAEYGESFRRITRMNYNGEMDHLFGCIVNESDGTNNTIDLSLAKYLTEDNHWIITNAMLTDKPHPYSTGLWQVQIPEGKHDQAQAKALACGFKWKNKTKWVNSFNRDNYLCINNGVLTHARNSFDIYTTYIYTQLTFEQFMDGDVPGKKVEEPMPEKFFCVATPDQLDEYGFDSAKDAILLCPSFSGNKVGWNTLNTHNTLKYLQDGYTIIPFNDFKAKFPPKAKEKITLFGYDVEVLKDGRIKVGCEDNIFTIEEIKGFMKIITAHFKNIDEERFTNFNFNEIEDVLNKLKPQV